MSSEETVDFILQVDVEPTRRQFQQLLTVINRTFRILERMGLPPEISKIINTMQRAIMVIRQTQLALYALQAAAGPIGWAFAITGVAVTAISAADLTQDLVS